LTSREVVCYPQPATRSVAPARRLWNHQTIEQHYKDLIVIIKILLNANMKISIEKSQFFKLEANFLGYVVSHNVIKTDPEQISTIVKYPIPKSIRELRSFLRLTG